MKWYMYNPDKNIPILAKISDRPIKNPLHETYFVMVEWNEVEKGFMPVGASDEYLFNEEEILCWTPFYEISRDLWKSDVCGQAKEDIWN